MSALRSRMLRACLILILCILAAIPISGPGAVPTTSISVDSAASPTTTGTYVTATGSEKKRDADTYTDVSDSLVPVAKHMVPESGESFSVVPKDISGTAGPYVTRSMTSTQRDNVAGGDSTDSSAELSKRTGGNPSSNDDAGVGSSGSATHNAANVPPAWMQGDCPPGLVGDAITLGKKYRIYMRQSTAALTQQLRREGILQVGEGSQSTYHASDTLRRNGWIPEEGSSADLFSRNGELPILLFMNARGLTSNPQRNARIKTKHSLPYGPEMNPPTRKEYDNVYNHEQGAIYSLTGLDANEQLHGSTTGPLRAWSDVAFLENKMRSDADASSLKYIFQAPIMDKATQHIVNFVMTGNANRHSMPPDSLTAGKKVARGSYSLLSSGAPASDALLGSPAALRVVKLLIQHKDATTGLGIKRLSRIGIMRDDAVKPDDWSTYKGPTLIFQIEDVPADLVLDVSPNAARPPLAAAQGSGASDSNLASGSGSGTGTGSDTGNGTGSGSGTNAGPGTGAGGESRKGLLLDRNPAPRPVNDPALGPAGNNAVPQGTYDLSSDGSRVAYRPLPPPPQNHTHHGNKREAILDTDGSNASTYMSKRTGGNPSGGGGSSSGGGGGGGAAMAGPADPYALPPVGATPASINSWVDAHEARGRTHLHYLRETDDALNKEMDRELVLAGNGESQSVFETHKALEEYGWTHLISSTFNAFQPTGVCPIATLLTRYGLNSGELANALVTSKQSNAFHMNNQQHNPTNIEYKNIYNPVDGVVYALTSFSPHEPLEFADSSAPPLRTWSDVTYLELQKRAHDARARSPGSSIRKLKYVVQVRCNDPITKGLVNHLLNADGDPHRDAMASRADISQNVLHGLKTYKLDGHVAPRRKAVALLSSPAAMRVIMLLAQHKGMDGHEESELGHKRLASITIFRDDAVQHNNDWTNYHGPTLLFEIADVPHSAVMDKPLKYKTATKIRPLSKGEGKGKGKGKDRDGGKGDKRPNPFGQPDRVGPAAPGKL